MNLFSTLNSLEIKTRNRQMQDRETKEQSKEGEETGKEEA